jgi:hypothetical protein
MHSAYWGAGRGKIRESLLANLANDIDATSIPLTSNRGNTLDCRQLYL